MISKVSAQIFDDDFGLRREFFRDGYFYPGDLGVVSPDGRLALHGRVTDVVNVFGTKYAPGPIEEELQNALGAGGVCAFSLPRDDGEEVLHVVIESTRRSDDAKMAAVLRRLLTGTPQSATLAAKIQVQYVRALDPGLIVDELAIVKRLAVVPDTEKNGLGAMNRDKMRRTVDFINNNVDVQGRKLTLEDIYREGYLPSTPIRP